LPTTPPREGRIQPIEKRQLEPFLRAPQSTGCELYWISVSAWPAPVTQRTWLIDFFQRLNKFLAQEHSLRGEFFLQQQTVPQVEKQFRKLAVDLLPKLGLARKPNAPMPPPPSMDQLKGAVRGEAFEVSDHLPDYCYWFHHPDLPSLLGEFFGLGGSAMFYLKPDPATKTPEIPLANELRQLFPQMRWDRLEMMMQAGSAVKDGFLAASKKLFGEGLEEEPEYAGLSYIVPLLRTGDFFNQPETERQKWFQLFDLFWRESPADKGIYIASKLPLEEPLSDILKAMKEEGKLYPER
jgi:hypothetical protein